MLNHLFATTLICLGVANTTPISNYDQEKSNLVLTTPKKANQVADYELSLTVNNTVINNTEYNDSFYGTIYPFNYKSNISGGNAYLNIIGNRYITNLTATKQNENGNDVNVCYVLNSYTYMNDPDPQGPESAKEGFISNNYDESQYVSKQMIALQITPYNYNVETEIKIRVNVNTYSWAYNSNINWYNFKQTYVRKRIYTSTEPSWASYIGQQLTNYQVYNIQNDIKNINNAFYYTENIDDKLVGTGNINETYEDETTITIVPNMNNYIIIAYAQSVVLQDTGGNTTSDAPIMPVNRTQNLNLSASNIRITGTNIIPDGTYEVIDIPGLMYEVIGMPFAFVSQAFNLTLFPGTPYQINIANLFLSIAAIFVFVWLLILFIKMKG